jgi:hypothetical protein
MGARLCKDVPAQLLPIAAQAATPIGAAPVKHAQNMPGAFGCDNSAAVIVLQRRFRNLTLLLF